ncbi:MAG TPA: hypothetical protein VGD78_23615 [Chthoniobacterales bacterium]
MATSESRKQQIVEELAQVRRDLSTHGKVASERLNVQRHVSTSLRVHSFSWVSLAAVIGWVISRLPARRQKVFIETGKDGDVKRKKTKEVGLMSHAWKGVWAVAKPLLTAYITRRITGEKTRKSK